MEFVPYGNSISADLKNAYLSLYSRDSILTRNMAFIGHFRTFCCPNSLADHHAHAG